MEKDIINLKWDIVWDGTSKVSNNYKTFESAFTEFVFLTKNSDNKNIVMTYIGGVK